MKHMKKQTHKQKNYLSVYHSVCLSGGREARQARKLLWYEQNEQTKKEKKKEEEKTTFLSIIPSV